MNILGESVVVVPWIHFIIGDWKGNRRLIAGYNNNTGTIARPFGMCHCTDMSATDIKCQFVTIAEINEYNERASFMSIEKAEEMFKEISRHYIKTCWDNGVPLGDIVHGINLICPPEVLHVIGAGLAKYLVGVIQNCIIKGRPVEEDETEEETGDVDPGEENTGEEDVDPEQRQKKKKKKKKKRRKNDKTEKLRLEALSELDLLYAQAHKAMQRCSERDYYQGSLIHASTETTKQGAIENIGNLFLLAFLSRTEAGKKIYKDHEVGYINAKEKETEEDRFYPIITFLSSIGWFHTSNPKHDVHCAQQVLKDTIDDIESRFSRKEGLGFSIPKKHLYLLFRVYIMFYGNAFNFYGGWGERGHIDYVKDNAKNTQRQASKFLAQLGTRVEERAVLAQAEDCIISQFSDEVADMSQKNSLRKKQIEMEDYSTVFGRWEHDSPVFVKNHEGGYTLHIKFHGNTDSVLQHELSDETQCVIDARVVWMNRDAEKQKIGRSLNYELQLFIAKQALKLGLNDETEVNGYTMTCVQFPDLPSHTIIRCTEDYNCEPWYDFVTVEVDGVILPAKVVGIFTYCLSDKFVVRCMHKPVVHKYNFLDELLEHFFVPFQLGGFDAMKIVDVKFRFEH
jgi:hypothetical protein